MLDEANFHYKKKMLFETHKFVTSKNVANLCHKFATMCDKKLKTLQKEPNCVAKRK